MFSKPIQNLIEQFMKFPGVGPKQATRFVFHLLREEHGRLSALADTISKLRDDVKLCHQCYKSFDVNGLEPGSPQAELCELCRSRRRDTGQVLVAEKEVDLENIERTGKYNGLYHVLGGTISPLDSSAPAKLRLRELFERVRLLAAGATENNGVEVILATNPTAEGDATALYLERIFSPLKTQYPSLTVSRLGRGLTTGSELEYSDSITIANALQNRK